MSLTAAAVTFLLPPALAMKLLLASSRLQLSEEYERRINKLCRRHVVCMREKGRRLSESYISISGTFHKAYF